MPATHVRIIMNLRRNTQIRKVPITLPIRRWRFYAIDCSILIFFYRRHVMILRFVAFIVGLKLAADNSTKCIGGFKVRPKGS